MSACQHRFTRGLTVFVLAFVCVAALSLVGHADVERIAPQQRGITVEVIGDERGTLSLFSTGGGWWERSRSPSYYVEAMRGERYRLRVRNDSGRRVGLVIAVDGRNIITGDRSYLRSSEGMYILNPWSAGEFSGWRTSTQNVARFYFTDEEDSYAGRWGDSSQMGYINIAVFDEQRPIYYEERLSMKDGGAAPRTASKIAPDRMQESSEAGTGYGEREYSPVETTTFDAETFARERISIRYEWPEKLRRYHAPPAYEDSGHFSPPPPRR